MTHEPLEIVPSPVEEVDRLSRSVVEHFRGRDEIDVLEAGCGQNWWLQLNGLRYNLTGIDINPEALRLRTTTQQDLDEAILGDLRTANFDNEAFDLIYNAFVLEHIDGAETVLENFSRWLSAGGLLIIRIPDGQSVYGFVTRSTPHWLHVLYARYVEGQRTAGQSGHYPFPTIYDSVVSRRGIHTFCAEHNLRIRAEFASNHYLRNFGPLRPVVYTLVKAVAWLSGDRLSADHNNLTYIIEKAPRLRGDASGAEHPGTRV